MKCKNLISFIALLLVPLSYACDNGNDPTPVYSGPCICARDSVALTDIYLNVFGEMPKHLWETYESAEDGTLWKLDLKLNNDNYEFVVNKLQLNAGCLREGVNEFKEISPAINDLSDITELDIRGFILSGDFPKVDRLNELRRIVILGTSLRSIPDDMFSEKTEYIYIWGNAVMTCSLPSSLSKLVGRTNFWQDDRKFDLSSNGFTGSIPSIPNASVNLKGNYLTSYPMDILENASLKYDGIIAHYNFIEQDIPIWVLEDTVKIIALYRDANLQQSARGFRKMTSGEDISKMYQEYVSNHPEAIE